MTSWLGMAMGLARVSGTGCVAVAAVLETGVATVVAAAAADREAGPEVSVEADLAAVRPQVSMTTLMVVQAMTSFLPVEATMKPSTPCPKTRVRRDDYRGGHGIDTLTLNFTLAEWFQPDVQADIANYLAFIQANTDPVSGEANSNVFQFTAFDLSAREFENLRVFVDGVELDPADDPADAIDDSMGVQEDDGNTVFAGSVLDNDNVPDLVYAVRLISTTAEGVLTFNEGTPGAPDGSFSFDPNGDFEDLAEGETRDVTFVYEVEDANGDTDQATVTITVTGNNDAPTLAAGVGNATEDGADRRRGACTAWR